MGKLDGKVALITGAGSGMGRQTARLFVAEGAKVAVVDMNLDTAQDAVIELGDAAFAVAANVTQRADMDAAVKASVDHFGQIDIIFNNAGISGPHMPFHEQTHDLIKANIDVNLWGVINGMQAVLPYFLQQGHGVILSTASASGLVGWKGLGAYSAAKAAVVGLTRSVALDYATSGIRVNAIAPGMVFTGLAGNAADGSSPVPDYQLPFPMQRFGTTKEIAAAALFLASDDASFITGVTLPVDGGYVAE